jgi:DNA repair exonuclease SbcCD nuclease subunit/energy-coupling factor transporter ATP-binding protein EcfA2
MKFLALGDLHIRDYKLYNSDESHAFIPDRLLLYRTLAEDIKKAVIENGCKFVVIAGDIFDIHTNAPPVLNILKEFLSIISETCDVYLTHGQHDISTKTIDDSIGYLTALTVFNSDKVHYYHDKVVHISKKGKPTSSDLSSFCIYFYGWTPDIPTNMPLADVFVGHQMVYNSSDFFGYVFQGGYDPAYLSDQYKFSILGDIHSRQVINSNILIPGPPIQNKFKDSPVNGVWVIDTKSYTPEFIEFKSSIYPKFYLVDNDGEIPKESPDNHFYKVISRSTAGSLTKIVQTASTLIDTWKLIEDLIDVGSYEEKEGLKLLARKHYEDSFSESIEGRKLADVQIQSVHVENFLSIKKLDFTFSSGLTLFTGSIGSGKSTLLEAVPYALYGKTSKSRYKDDVSPNCYSGETKVSLKFKVNEIEYVVIRKIGKLSFKVNDKEISGSRISETQQLINEILGLSYEEFSTLVFFSQDTGTFFGKLSEDQQLALMSLFLGSHTERVELLNSAIQAQFKKFKETTMSLDNTIKILNERVLRHNSSLYEIQQSGKDIKALQTEFFKNKGYSDVSDEVLTLAVEGHLKEAANLYLGFDIDELKSYRERLITVKSKFIEDKFEIESKYSKINMNKNLLTERYNFISNKLSSYNSGVCPECGQNLPTSESFIVENVKELNIVKEELSGIEDVSSLKEEIDSFTSRIGKLDVAIKESNDKVSLFNSFVSCDKVEFKKSEEIELLISTIRELEDQISSCESKLEISKQQFGFYSILHKQVFCDSGLKSKCIESVGFMLSEHVNNLFKEVGLDVSVDIKTVSYKKSGAFDSSFDVTARFNGIDTSYRMASGGQKMLIDLASIVSIYNLLSSTYGLERGIFGFICLDEFVRYLDDSNLEAVFDLLDHLVSDTKLLVSHDSKLKQMSVKNTVGVSRINGMSNYLIS